MLDLEDVFWKGAMVSHSFELRTGERIVIDHLQRYPFFLIGDNFTELYRIWNVCMLLHYAVNYVILAVYLPPYFARTHGWQQHQTFLGSCRGLPDLWYP